MEKQIKSLLADPIANLNSLNAILPSLASHFEEGQDPSVFDAASQMLEAFSEKKLLGAQSKVRSFILDRFAVLAKALAYTAVHQDTEDPEALFVFLREYVKAAAPAQENPMSLEENLSLLEKDEVLASFFEECVSAEFPTYLKECTRFADVQYLLLNACSKKENLSRKQLFAAVSSCGVFIGKDKEEEGQLEVQLLTYESQNADDEGDEDTFTKDELFLINKVRSQYQVLIQTYLKQVETAPNSELKAFLLQIPKNIIQTVEQPLILGDFLTSCLKQQENLQLQIIGLRTMFLLIEKHGLDFPKYYDMLYSLLQPKFNSANRSLASIFNMEEHPEEKKRFLRLLDLSLRSPKLPSKLVAAFLKRVCRLVVAHGVTVEQSDKMWVVSFVANMIKRHPRCYRLVERKRKIHKPARQFAEDPYKSSETDPLRSKALKSSLWEIDVIMKDEFDESVRNYAKLFKGDLSRKSSFFKCEEFTAVKELERIKAELEGIDQEKEAASVRKNIILKFSA